MSSNYAVVAWSPDDILSMRPSWTEEQAEEFLRRNNSHIADRMVEVGWSVIEDILAYEEVEKS